MNLTPEEREQIYKEELEKRRRLENLTQKERELIFQEELVKRNQDFSGEKSNLEVPTNENPSDTLEERYDLIYRDVDLNPPPIRNGVTGVIGTIWFFGMLLLFGFIGVIWAIIIAVSVFFLIVIGLRIGFLPLSWSIPYFTVTCPSCHIKFQFFMNDNSEDYHPEFNHTYDTDCDKCGHFFIIKYKYTGSYDAKWDKLR